MQVDFHEELTRHVTDAGSQSALARRLGVKQSYVSKLMRGAQAPSDRILKALGMSRVIVRVK